MLVIQRELPDAKIAIDKFHVIIAANRTLDELRKIIVGKNYNVRRALFKGKERLYEREKQKLAFLFEKYKNFPALII